MGLDAGNDARDALAHGRKIHRSGNNGRQPEIRGPAGQMAHPGRFNEGFTWHAAIMQAVAAKGALALDQEHPHTQARRPGRNRQPGRAAAQNHQIVLAPLSHAASFLPNYTGPPMAIAQIMVTEKY